VDGVGSPLKIGHAFEVLGIAFAADAEIRSGFVDFG
jgi:hypothetical protein